MISISIATKGLFPGHPVAVATIGYFIIGAVGVIEPTGIAFIIEITHKEIHAITIT